MPDKYTIKSIEVENGRAAIELTLPDCSLLGENSYYEIYLWEMGEVSKKDDWYLNPAFYCVCPSDKDDTCVMRLVRPHLWEGAEKPYLYKLEIYTCVDADLSLYSGRETPALAAVSREWCNHKLLTGMSLAIRDFREIPQKGYFLNGRTFSPKGVYYERIEDIPDTVEGLTQRLQTLVQMGANVLTLGPERDVSGQSEPVKGDLQECCDRVGLILLQDKPDTCVNGKDLFDCRNLPTDTFYRYKALWSKTPFIYISAHSLCRQPGGGYELIVYSNCKKVTLMVNGKVFGVQEGGGELIFQDIQIKGFPVDITAQSEECSMSVKCYKTY